MTLFHSCNAWDNGRGKFVIWPLIRELLVPATGAVCRRHQRTPRSPPTRRNTYIYACKWINECKRRGRTVQKEGKKKTKYYKIEKTLKERTTEIGNMLYMLCSHTYNFIYWFWFGAAAAIKWFFFLYYSRQPDWPVIACADLYRLCDITTIPVWYWYYYTEWTTSQRHTLCIKISRRLTDFCVTLIHSFRVSRASSQQRPASWLQAICILCVSGGNDLDFDGPFGVNPSVIAVVRWSRPTFLSVY